MSINGNLRKIIAPHLGGESDLDESQAPDLDRGRKKEGIFSLVKGDIRSVFERDPAARSTLEILFCYPGLHAVWGHRISHWM